MKKSIILYNPQAPYFTFPLPLLAVTTMLDRSKYDIKIIDARIEANAHQQVLNSLDNALCVGISVLTGSPIQDAVALTSLIKKHRPNIPVIWGGWHPSIFPEQCMTEGKADYVVTGQGETTFKELIETIENKSQPTAVAGLGYKTSSDISVNPPRMFQNVDEFPAYDYDLIPVETYFKHKKSRQLDFYTSQGCPYRCNFCADPMVFNRRWSGIPAERIIEELTYLILKYNANEVFFHDETFFVNQKRVITMSEGFSKHEFPVTWAAAARADQIAKLPDDLLAIIAKSRCRKIVIGAESGSQQMLDRIEKDTLAEETIISAENLSRHGIGAVFNFIVGFPEESMSTIRETLDSIKRILAINPHFEFSIFYYTPYPGTGIFDYLKSKNYRLPQTLMEWSDFDYILYSGYWVPDEAKDTIEKFKFYHKLAYRPDEVWDLLKPVSSLAKIRCRRNYYDFPIEKSVINFVRYSILGRSNW